MFEKKKKIFISQPMKDLSRSEILNKREWVVRLLDENGFHVVNSVLHDVKNKTPLWCLGKSLQILSECDCVYFMAGWEEARGCRLEHEAAEEYGIEIYKD